ncbi:MAG: hypothetical protein Q8799_02590, partial [Candidatus Phytoplasma australasiaticum]|nr:hypothetical protein [Candidatus Phytoplasma australasiaticum]MDV3175405.1 hypothetical protein [Candidatus Phytoplasma australasiaticum]
TVIFCANIKHAYDITETFQKAGIKAQLTLLQLMNWMSLMLQQVIHLIQICFGNSITQSLAVSPIVSGQRSQNRTQYQQRVQSLGPWLIKQALHNQERQMGLATILSVAEDRPFQSI